jgi:hypothetical protein
MATHLKHTVPNLEVEEEIRPLGERNRVTFTQHTFHWLLEKLLPPTDRVFGCELWVPDTAIFENGKPKLVVKSDSVNGCLI